MLKEYIDRKHWENGLKGNTKIKHWDVILEGNIEKVDIETLRKYTD